MKVKKQVLACALTCCVAGAALSGVVWDGHSANGGGMQVGYLIAKNMAKGSDVDEDELTTRLTVGGSVAGTLVGARIGATIGAFGGPLGAFAGALGGAL